MPNNFYQSTSNWEQGYKLFAPFENIYGSAGRLGNQLADFTSPFYQQFRSYLGSTTPTLGTNTFLSGLQAGGGNYAGSQVQANALQQNYLKQRNDFLNQSVRGFASQNISMLPNLYQIMTQAAAIPRQITMQNAINESQQGGALDFLGAPFGSLFGQFGAGLFGSAVAGSGLAASAMQAAPALAASDVRLKENINYTGEETKDGIPIVEFNYKGNDQRFRGVIAQDAEKIRPDAVVEINGTKHVYYGRL